MKISVALRRGMRFGRVVRSRSEKPLHSEETFPAQSGEAARPTVLVKGFSRLSGLSFVHEWRTPEHPACCKSPHGLTFQAILACEITTTGARRLNCACPDRRAVRKGDRCGQKAKVHDQRWLPHNSLNDPNGSRLACEKGREGLNNKRANEGSFLGQTSRGKHNSASMNDALRAFMLHPAEEPATTSAHRHAENPTGQSGITGFPGTDCTSSSACDERPDTSLYTEIPFLSRSPATVGMRRGPSVTFIT